MCSPKWEHFALLFRYSSSSAACRCSQHGRSPSRQLFCAFPFPSSMQQYSLQSYTFQQVCPITAFKRRISLIEENPVSLQDEQCCPLHIPYKYSDVPRSIAGLAPTASRFFIFWGFHILFSQTGVSMFRFIAALGRTFEVANSYGNLAVILQMILVRMHGGVQSQRAMDNGHLN